MTYAPALDVLLVRRDANAPGACDNSQALHCLCDPRMRQNGRQPRAEDNLSESSRRTRGVPCIYDLMEGLIGASRAATVGGREARVQSELQRTTAKGCGVWSGKLLETGKSGRTAPHGVGQADRDSSADLVAEMGLLRDGTRPNCNSERSYRLGSLRNLTGSFRGRGRAWAEPEPRVIVQYKQAPKSAPWRVCRATADGWGETGPDQGRPSQSQSMRWRPWKTIRRCSS